LSEEVVNYVSRPERLFIGFSLPLIKVVADMLMIVIH